MTDKKKEEQRQGENNSPAALRTSDKENSIRAHEMAEKDIADDPDMSMRSPNDDLDEGESARLGDGADPVV